MKGSKSLNLWTLEQRDQLDCKSVFRALIIKTASLKSWFVALDPGIKTPGAVPGRRVKPRLSDSCLSRRATKTQPFATLWSLTQNNNNKNITKFGVKRQTLPFWLVWMKYRPPLPAAAASQSIHLLEWWYSLTSVVRHFRTLSLARL